jgi:hypothetical protein
MYNIAYRTFVQLVNRKIKKILKILSQPHCWPKNQQERQHDTIPYDKHVKLRNSQLEIRNAWRVTQQMPKRTAQNKFSIIRAGTPTPAANFLKIFYPLFPRYLPSIYLPFLLEISSQTRKPL